jgi:hypothetical protein
MSAIARVLLVLMSVAAALAAVEAYLRIQAPPSPGAPLGSDARMTTIDGAIAYEPGSSFTYTNEARERIEVAIDSRGFRNPGDEDLAPGTAVLLGDSFVAAVNTREPDTVAGNLRKAGVRVVNAGVDGTGTITHTDIFEHRFKHDGLVVILLFYLGNDFRDNYWTSPIPIVMTSAQQRRARLSEFFDRCAWSRLCVSARDRLVVSPYAIDPMGSYALSELQMIGPSSPGQVRALDTTRAALTRLSEVVRERQGRLLVVGIPSKAQMLRSFREVSAFDRDPEAEPAAKALIGSGYSWEQPDRFLAAACRQLAVEYLSLMGPFRERNKADELYYRFDVHWNSTGQRVAADEIVSALARGNAVAAIAPGAGEARTR